MKGLAQKFLSDKDRQKINATVQAAEKKTSGEIVCLVQSTSYHYPMADVIGGVTLALPGSLLLTPYVGGLFWLGNQNMWIFLGVFTILFVVFHWVVQRNPAIKYRFISRHEMNEEVREAAVNAFFNHRLYQTKDANAVLLFISVFEHRVWILADQGINAKINQHVWDDIVAQVTKGIKANQATAAISRSIQDIGNILQAHFPVKPDDINELEDLIVTSD